jgi:hypothetical protein
MHEHIVEKFSRDDELPLVFEHKGKTIGLTAIPGPLTAMLMKKTLFPLSPTRVLNLDNRHIEPANQYHAPSDDGSASNLILRRGANQYMFDQRHTNEVCTVMLADAERRRFARCRKIQAASVVPRCVDQQRAEPGLGGVAGGAAVPGHRHGRGEIDRQRHDRDLGGRGDLPGGALRHRGDEVAGSERGGNREIARDQ